MIENVGHYISLQHKFTLSPQFIAYTARYLYVYSIIIVTQISNKLNLDNNALRHIRRGVLIIPSRIKRNIKHK